MPYSGLNCVYSFCGKHIYKVFSKCFFEILNTIHNFGGLLVCSKDKGNTSKQ